MTSESSPEIKAPRDISIDVARGIAIILVVFGHAWRGGYSAGLLSDEPLFQLIDNLIYLFHMPLFFILSGYFFEKALAAKPASFVWQRIVLLLYPLCVWTWLMALGKIAAASYVNDPIAWSEFPVVPFPAQWQFWFLWALFLIQMLIYFLKYVSTSHIWLIAIALTAIVWPLFLYVPAHMGQAVWNLPFFVIGMLLPHYRQWRTIPAWAAIGTFVGVELLALTLQPMAPVLNMVFAAIASVCVMSIAQALTHRFAPQSALKILVLLGSATMPIYLAHTFFSAPARMAGQALGVTHPFPQMAVTTLVGLIFPLVLYTLSRRLGVNRLLGF